MGKEGGGGGSGFFRNERVTQNGEVVAFEIGGLSPSTNYELTAFSG